MAAASETLAALANLKLDEDEFLALMEKVIGLGEKLQNNPPELVPQEELVADLVVEELASVSNGNGPLQVKKLTYVSGRSNVIVTYPGTTDKVVSFVGSHMDVVFANPDSWERNPFEMQVDGDIIYGRGECPSPPHTPHTAHTLTRPRPQAPPTVWATSRCSPSSSAPCTAFRSCR